MGKSQKPSVLALVRQAGYAQAAGSGPVWDPTRIPQQTQKPGHAAPGGTGTLHSPRCRVDSASQPGGSKQKGAQGVICLLSALQFHELTTQLPFQVWMAIPNKARQPKVDGLQIRFARFSGLAFDEGIETHTIEHIQVRIYNPAKTVADCFKYRNKIGLDVAIESLRDCMRERKASLDDPLVFRTNLSDDQCDAALYGGSGMSTGKRKHLPVSVRQRLRNLRDKTGEDYQLLLTTYAVERLLYRLSQSEYADRFVLKGAMLFVALTGKPHRATRDLDLLGYGDASAEHIAQVFRQLSTTSVEPDGMVFDPEDITVQAIREDQVYESQRVPSDGPA